MWNPFDEGRTVGTQGSENGMILRDEEHRLGARMTLEHDGYQPFSITCGIYGWMVHTRFFSSKESAVKAFEEMKDDLARIMAIIPYTDDPEVEHKVRLVDEAISNFIEKFP